MLTTLLSAPRSPIECPGDWSTLEARAGIPFSADYKAYLRLYGTGKIGDFLWVMNPAARNVHLNLIVRATKILSVLREIRSADEVSSETPFKIYPETGGSFLGERRTTVTHCIGRY